MNILIVDDEPLFRMGVKAFLETTPGMRVIGEAGTARAAFVVLDRSEVEPDVILLDIMLPGLDGFAAARELRRRCERAKIVMVTGARSAREVIESFHAGASGYVVKTDAPESLMEAIRKVGQGETFVAASLDEMTKRLIERNEPLANVLSPLSEREREVFGLLVRGQSNNRAARELCISRKTLDTHRHRIYEKLGLHSMVDLVRFASDNGLLPHSDVNRLDGGTDAAAAALQ